MTDKIKPYSKNWYNNFNTMREKQAKAIVQDEARLANELQEQFPNMTRTHALQEAKRMIGLYGIGVSLAKE